MANIATSLRSQFRPVLNNLSTSLANNVIGRGNPVSDPFASLNNKGLSSQGRTGTAILTYPLGIDDTANGNGHYIMFDILTRDKVKVQKTTKKGLSPGALGGRLELKAPSTSKALLASTPTTRIQSCIALYMPPTVSVNYATAYNETEIGALAEGAGAAIQKFIETKSVAAAGVAAKGALSQGVQSKILSGIDAVATGAKALLEIQSGQILTPRMEIMFQGIGRRSFSFEFTFIPKSVQEAEQVEKIIKKFKFHQASNFGSGIKIPSGSGSSKTLGSGTGVRAQTIPDMFEIRNMLGAQENPYLHKISTCVLETMQVDYGSDKYVAYQDGRPQSSKMSLSFKELELITKDKIENEGM